MMMMLICVDFVMVHWAVLGCGLVVTGMPISPNGIVIVKDSQGRAAGDGFVQFTSPDQVDRALEKHKEKIGHRWERTVLQSVLGLIIGC